MRKFSYTILVIYILTTVIACKKDTKFCYACHQSMGVNGVPARDFDTCFKSESDYTTHQWKDQNGNTLTVVCNKK